MMTNSKSIKTDNDNEVKLLLREEQLDINKNWIKTGDVTMHIEVVTAEETVTVPVEREVLVIEKKVLGNESSGEHSETIRIPVKEERIEVIKHSVILADINVYTQQFQETQGIEAVLKKEKAFLHTVGHAVVIDEDMKEANH